jgi:hypothetical protein
VVCPILELKGGKTDFRESWGGKVDFFFFSFFLFLSCLLVRGLIVAVGK